MKSITVPSTVRIIGTEAFALCEQLGKVDLWEGLEEIRDGAFAECISSRRISIRSTVKVINRLAFCYCKALEEAEFYDESSGAMTLRIV